LKGITMVKESMGRRPFLAAVLASTTFALAGCSGGTELPGELTGAGPSGASDTFLKNAPVAAAGLILPGSTMETIKKRGKLVVATALDAPLVSQQDPLNPDNVTGFDADMAKLLATYIFGQPNVQWVPSAAETREAMLANGTVDVVLSTYTITPKRALQISFAGPYFTSGLAVATKSDNTSIKGIEDLAGKTVIVQTGSPGVTQMPEKQPSATLMPFATTPQGVQALVQGRGDAYVQDYVLLASQASSNKDIKIVGQPFTQEPYGIGLKRDDQQLKDFVNTWLKAIYEGGQWAAAWKGTLGTVSDAAAPEPPAIGSVPGS
jgi:glutamate transport system substrate-binding protein